MRVRAVVNLNRPLHKRTLAEIREKLPDNICALFLFVFKGLVIRAAKVVRTQLDRHEIRVTGAVHLPGKNLFFLRHRNPLPSNKLCYQNLSTSTPYGSICTAPQTVSPVRSDCAPYGILMFCGSAV